METVPVMVYSFEVLEPEGVCHMPFKATREAVENRYGGRIIDGTGEEVHQSDLSNEGGYRRQTCGWTPQRLQQIE